MNRNREYEKKKIMNLLTFYTMQKVAATSEEETNFIHF